MSVRTRLTASGVEEWTAPWLVLACSVPAAGGGALLGSGLAGLVAPPSLAAVVVVAAGVLCGVGGLVLAAVVDLRLARDAGED